MVAYSVGSASGLTRRSGDLAALGRAVEGLAEDRFLWVELDEARGAQVAEVLDALGLDRFAQERVGRRHPKVDRAGGTSMAVVKTLWYIEDTRQIETGDLVIYAGDRSLLTVRHGEVDPVPAARERIAADGALRADGAAAAVYVLLDGVVDDYATVLEALTDEVDDIEREVFSESRHEVIGRIYSLIRETLEFRDAVKPLMPFARMVRQREPSIPVFAHPYFRDIAGHLLRIESAVDSCMSLLTTVLSAHQGQIATWQNEDMRKISAWAAMAVAPTAIAGIYGMNFDHMPELHWLFGYPLVLITMAAICVLLYRGFKRNGWL